MKNSIEQSARALQEREQMKLDDEYLLGMRPAEVRRLEYQHRVWATATRSLWKTARFQSGDSLVDLGCGPGFTTLELADIAGDAGRVYAVDSSKRATNYLQRLTRERGNIEVIHSEAETLKLPKKVNGIFARWLFCFVPNPETLVRHCADLLERGGRLVVMDYANYLAIATAPASPVFRKIFRAVYESFAAAGGSLDVAGDLPRCCAEAGFEVTAVDSISGVGGPNSAVWNWVSQFQELYLPTLVEKGYFGREELEDYFEWWRERTNDPGSLFFAPPMLGVIAEKRE